MAKRPKIEEQPEEPGLQGNKVERDLDKRLLKQGYYFDPAQADRVCHFFETYLRHSKGPEKGKLFRLAPWQRAKLRRLFGWRRPNGWRRYTRTAWWLPRKNGKSTLAAGVALYCMIGEGEGGARVYSAASNKQQARNVWEEASNMVEQSPELSEVIESFTDSLFHQPSMSRYEPVSGKPKSAHGYNPSTVIIDEVHTLPDRALYSALTTGSGARDQPMEFLASTAGEDIGSFGYEQFEQAKQYLEGVLEDPAFLPVVYAADPDDDWQKEETWIKANPNWGYSVIPERFKDFVRKCTSPGAVAELKIYYLNIWAQSAKAWLSIEKWKKCGGAGDLEDYRGRKAYGGLDFSSTTDTTVFSLIIPMDDGTFHLLVWIFCPLDTAMERARVDKVLYLTWIEDGDLEATPGNVVDYARVRNFVVAASKVVDLQSVGYDKHNAAETVQILQDQNGINMVEMPQNFATLSPPAKHFEQLVLSKKLRHQNNKVLTWMAANVKVKKNATDDIMACKKKSTERIDGIVASIMALGRASLDKDNVITQGSILL